MKFKNDSKNHHFIAQIEQKMNAIDPTKAKKSRRIYKFEVIDKDSHKITSLEEKGVKIGGSLSYEDLYTFSILDEGLRENFEKIFQYYENSIEANTKSVLSKASTPNANIKSEILNIFRYKILNFVRNPYSIKKILNTFSELKGVIPTDPIHFENFERVLNGSNIQQDYLCEQLDITKDDYKEWLAIIFLLLNPMEENEINFLDQFIKRIYENPNSLIKVCIYTYDDETCLLSDRGFSFYELENNTTVWDFNLCSQGFIRYVFMNIEESVPQDTPQKILDMLKSTSNSVDWMTEPNDLIALEMYNQRTVELCYEHVFSSSLRCHGIEVV